MYKFRFRYFDNGSTVGYVARDNGMILGNIEIVTRYVTDKDDKKIARKVIITRAISGLPKEQRAEIWKDYLATHRVGKKKLSYNPELERLEKFRDDVINILGFSSMTRDASPAWELDEQVNLALQNLMSAINAREKQ